MELAIPLIALGGMYVISNQPSRSCDVNKKNKNHTKESYTNMGKLQNYLPNVNPPVQNYPVTNVHQLVDTVQEYPNPNVATDKYFDQNVYENRALKGLPISNNIQDIYSLTGNYLDSSQFKHNNMVPFNGGKVKSYTYNMDMAENILDNLSGSGSQLIKKVEQAPLFKPEDNIQWSYGMPNQSDFYQSRVNPAMRNNNVKPFATEYVGPGLNQGYSTCGSGGFNSGMEARDKWLPKTVDELRVDTNPKLEYELINHQGPANSQIKNLGMIGRVEKQTPDTFFMNTQDRWLTTTGLEKGETLRSIQELGIVKRNDVVSDYTGPAGSTQQKSGYTPTEFEQSKRQETMTCDVPLSTAVGKGPSVDMENAFRSHTNYRNHRSTVNQPDTYRSGFSGAIGAVIAPIMDIFRPSRKEETVQNYRVYGELGTIVPSSYVLNTNDIAPTTVKETTIYSPNFHINNQKEGIYINNYKPTDLTQRDTTNCSTYGNGGTAEAPMVYDAAYRQTNNDIKSQTIGNRPNQGGTQIFNQQMNVNISRLDSDRFNNRIATPASIVSLPPSVNNYGKINAPQYYDECANCDRIEPSILTAFKNNPYTHSLTSAV